MKRITTTFLAICLFLLPFGAAYGALTGAYTIGAGPASATNYMTFASAVSDLTNGTRADGGPSNGPGVSGPVTFTVSAGTYTEQFILPVVTGASAVNTITFDGVDPLTRMVTFASTVSGDRTILFNGADFFRFQNLTIQNTGTLYGFPVQLQSSADNNSFNNCRILMPITATASGKVGIVTGTSYTATGAFANNLSIQNCTFEGGYVGVSVAGSSTTAATGLVMTNNTFTDQYYSAIYIQYHTASVMDRNVMTLRNGNTTSYGAQIRYCNAFEFNRNRINNVGQYGLYIFSSNASTGVPANITNNMIGGVFQNTGTNYGVYLTTNRFLNFYHNSVSIDAPAATGARGVYVLGTSSGLDLRNNVFSTTTAGASAYSIYVTLASYVSQFDYNDLWAPSGTLAYFGSNYATLAALQAGNPSFNQNSRNLNPNFVSSTNLHSYGPPLNNWAFNFPAVTVDYDGDSRPLAPDLIKDVGADEFVIPAIDPDLQALASPIVPVVGNNTFSATIVNNGSASMNGTPITLQYSTDGGATWPVTQTFTPTTLGTSGATETFTFTTPWTIASPATYTYCVRINPAVVGDPDPTDQICRTSCTGMGGAYTVNGALPTSGTNFNNFTDMAAALGGCGVAAPVTITVAPGLYVQTFTIPLINGVSSTNTVTIDGVDTALVTIAYNHTTANASVVTLDNSDYVTIKNLKVNSVGSTYGSCIKYTNTANYNTVDNCVLTMPIVSTSVYHIGVLASGATYSTYGDHANYLTVKNTRIRGGYHGLRLLGSTSTSVAANNRVQNCRITEFYYYGIYTYYQGSPEFLDNNIFGRATGVTNTFGYGIYSYYGQGNFRISGNTIHTIPTYGIYLGYGNNDNSGKGRVDNNMIGANFYVSGTPYGIYAFNTRDTDFWHNSIHTNGFGYAMYISGSPPSSDSLRLLNNIFSAGSGTPGIGGRALYVVTPSAIQSLNYNIYFSLGSQIVYWGGVTYNSLSTWQTAVPAFNANSFFDDPGFPNPTNLHLVCSPGDNLGTPLPLVPLDIDEQSRSATTPDIGADEYTSISVSTSLGPDISVCDRTTLYADTVNFQTFLWGGGQFTNFLNVDTTGLYSIYVIDSNNCRARDSIFVTVDSLPLRAYEGDTLAVCDNATLDAQNPGSTYQWSNGPTTQTNTPGTNGLFFVTITTPAGCSITDSVTLQLYANPTLELGNDTTFCLGSGAFLDAGSGPVGTTYSWNSGASTQVVVISSPGMYQVTVTSPFGCVSEDSVNLNILLSPVVNLGPNFTTCTAFTLDAQNPGNSYAWSNFATSQTITASTPGTYSVTVTNANGCTATDAVTVNMATAPVVALGPDVVICGGQTATLNAGNFGMSHLWSTGATTQSITVGNAGTYIANVTDPGSGCTTADTIEVVQSFMSLNLGANFTLCPGDTATLDAGAAPNTYDWSTGASTQTIQVSAPGTYSVTVTDALGCVLNDAVTISGGTAPTAAFTPSATNTPLFQPITYTDNSTGATSWHWDFGDGFTSTQQNPSYTHLAMGTFTVCLTASNGGCSNTICQTVTIGPPLEIEDELFANHAVQLYPNPTTGKFSLDFDLSKAVDLNIDVLSLTGQTMAHTSLRAVRFKQENFDLEGIAAGVYFVRVTTDKGDTWLRKLVVE